MASGDRLIESTNTPPMAPHPGPLPAGEGARACSHYFPLRTRLGGPGLDVGVARAFFPENVLLLYHGMRPMAAPHVRSVPEDRESGVNSVLLWVRCDDRKSVP